MRKISTFRVRMLPRERGEIKIIMRGVKYPWALALDDVDDEGLIRAVIRGTSRALLLWILDRKHASGYELTKELERLTGHEQSVGVVYPLLYEFEERGLITGEWEQRGKRRRIKTYSITDLGRNMLNNIRELLEMPVREVINDLLLDDSG
jgi:DNA-binding PadR family transcriptional regulator